MTKKQAKEIVSAVNRIMGYREDKNPKKDIWHLLKFLAVFTKKEENRLKGVRWLSNQLYQFSKTDFKK